MARKHHRPVASSQRFLAPLRTRCWICDGPAWIAYHATRTVLRLDGLCQLRLKVRRCENPTCARYHQPYRPEDESAIALPHGEFGLDVIGLIGALRYAEHRSVPEIHHILRGRGLASPSGRSLI